jgi:hypothetical protein
MKTLAQVSFEIAKPDCTFEEYREILLKSGAFSVETLDFPVKIESQTKKSITPRSVNWKGHEVIRRSLKKDTKLSEIVPFLINVIHDRLQKTGKELNVELVDEWKSKVEPYLNELSTKDAVEVSLEWLKKATSLGELNSKAMKAYLNTKTRGSKSEGEDVLSQDNNSFFPEEEV